MNSYVDLPDGTRIFYEEIADDNEIDIITKEHFENTDLFVSDFKKEII